MGMRELKALELAARAKITWDGEAWSVPSQSTRGTYRVVTWPGAESCECEDWQRSQEACKHGLAARIIEQPVRDRLFACAFKVYCLLSSRRFGSDLADAHTAGHLSRSLHPNKVNCFIESPDLTAPLRELVARSALPLRAVETEFAVDSSGFTT